MLEGLWLINRKTLSPWKNDCIVCPLLAELVAVCTRVDPLGANPSVFSALKRGNEKWVLKQAAHCRSHYLWCPTLRPGHHKAASASGLWEFVSIRLVLQINTVLLKDYRSLRFFSKQFFHLKASRSIYWPICISLNLRQ